MAIDKELFYASHGLKYPVVTRPYTDDMEVKEKFYTKDEVITMLTEIQLEIEELNTPPAYQDEDYFLIGTNRCSEIIQQKIDKCKAESEDK